MARGIYWNGKVYDLPTAAAIVDPTGLNRVGLAGANRLAILGDFYGLIPPKTAKLVMSESLAKKLIHPDCAEARKAVEFAFDPAPGSEYSGASEVLLVPVGNPTQATKTLSAVVTATSIMYGLPANQVKLKIENGTTGKKVTIGFGESIESPIDNISKPSFSIQYIGTGSASALTITPTAAGHSLTTTCTGAGADDLNIDLNAYNTIQKLADFINATGKYTFSILTDTPSDSCMELDAVSGQAIKAAAYTAKSDLQAFVDTLNENNGYITFARVADAGSVPANTDWTYLTGAVNGTTVNADWQAAVDLLKSQKVDLVVPLTSSASIHAIVDTFCDTMNQPDSFSRPRAFTGIGKQSWANESARTAAVAAIKAAIKALNSNRSAYPAIGCKSYDENGDVKTWPSYITACLYAGLAAGGKPTLPLTRKPLRILGLEVDLRKEEVTELLRAGAAVPIPGELVGVEGYVISRSITTWLQDDNLYNVEFSVGRGSDYVAVQVLRAHSELIGEEGSEGFETTLLNLTNGVLRDLKINGMIRAYDKTKTVIRVDGDARFVDYEAEPILPINWIFSTYHPKLTKFTFKVE